MTVPVGGLRARYIRDSLYTSLKASLTALGWFQAGRQHLPVTFPVEPIDPLTTVTLNAVGLASGNLLNSYIEVGSLLSEHRNAFFVDVFAESETLGLHLARDICDILEGRMPSVGQAGPILRVYDYSQATPPVIFTCEIESVAVDRAQYTTQAWQRFWFAVSFFICDYYGSEAG